MERYWLLTWTTYGSWLPGDRRGFVSSVEDGEGPQFRHNIPQTPYDADSAGLQHSARQQMKQAMVLLTKEQAQIVGAQFHETAEYRGWQLVAVAVMANHIHLIVGVPSDPDPESLLRDFKSYASRALNKTIDDGTTQRWWTRSGSKRKLKDDEALIAGTNYVANQDNPLYLWICES